MVSQQVQDSVVEELRKDIIPDNNYIRRIIESKPDLKDNIAVIAANDGQPPSGTPPTADVNYWRELVRKMPVSGPDMEMTIKTGIDKIIPTGKAHGAGYKNLANMLGNLGIEAISTGFGV